MDAPSGARSGESLASVQKFDVPIEATTPSLEALKAFSMGTITARTKGAEASIPFFKRALELDPNFAVAYVGLGVSYNNLGQTSLSAENLKKAYALRDRVSEHEKYRIAALYYQFGPGDLEQARQAYEIWTQAYPREHSAPNNLGAIYVVLGQYEKAVAKFRDAVRLSPDAITYANLLGVNIFLDHLDEAEATAKEAQIKVPDDPQLHSLLYLFAFLRNDMPGMAQRVAWSEGKPGVEDVMLAYEADTAGYSGRLGKARELSQRAVASAEHAEEKETAAEYEAVAGLREALFGNPTEARERAKAALALSTGRDAQYGAALALALAGDAGRAQALAHDLAKRFPEDTVVRFNYLPTIHAQLALTGNDRAKSPKAVEALQAAAPYELGQPGSGSVTFALYPVYVRGEAYLAAHEGSEAAAELQKILGHRGVVANEPIGALAHLGLARAYALQGDAAKARAAYNDFFTLWKDADPDIPILTQAKAEYAKLQ